MYRMKKEDCVKKRCLLIWPPFIAAYHLPLGIPFLVSYLKKRGIVDIEVADLNISYLKSSKIFYLLYGLNKRYHSLTGKAARAIGNAAAKDPDIASVASSRTKPSLRKMLSYIARHTSRFFSHSLERAKNRQKKRIPWSLKSILDPYSEKPYLREAKKIRKLLKPFIKRGKFSLIGISVIYPEQLFFALIIARVIKNSLGRDIKVVLGGAQVSKHLKALLESPEVNELVDFLIKGDGEEPLYQLLRTVPGNDFLRIPNLYHKSPSEDKKLYRVGVLVSSAPQRFSRAGFPWI